MVTYTIARHNLDGHGATPTRVYAVAPVGGEYWPAVTDIPCVADGCGGTIRWAEAGYAPGYRICDQCGRHYMASGTVTAPTLLRVGSRRSRVNRASASR